MNLTTEKKPLTLLFNPFFYVAGGKALWMGWRPCFWPDWWAR